MRLVNKREIESVLKTDYKKRYKYFINFVCDCEEAWGLYADGWALAGDNKTKEEFFLLWPEKVYADLCVEGEWSGYSPRSIPINELINDLIPELEKKGMKISIFYLPSNEGIVLKPAELLKDIKRELEKY